MTTRDRLLSRGGVRYVDVELMGGETVTLKSLTPGDLTVIELSMFDKKTGKMRDEAYSEVKFKRLSRSIVESDTRERSFNDDEWWQIRDEMDPRDVDRLYDAYSELMGDERKTVEELVGNSA